MMKKLYTIREVSEILNFKPDTIRKWLQKGKLTGRKVLGNWRVHIDDLQALLNEEEELNGRPAIKTRIETNN